MAFSAIFQKESGPNVENAPTVALPPILLVILNPLSPRHLNDI